MATRATELSNNARRSLTPYIALTLELDHHQQLLPVLEMTQRVHRYAAARMPAGRGEQADGAGAGRMVWGRRGTVRGGPAGAPDGARAAGQVLGARATYSAPRGRCSARRAAAANFSYKVLRLAARRRPQDLYPAGLGHILATTAATGALWPPHQSGFSARSVISA